MITVLCDDAISFREIKIMNETCRRILMTVFGVTICGLSVGMFSYSEMGLDPFQVFAHGTWKLTSLDFGTYYVILNAVLLVVIFFADKKKIGLGTLISYFKKKVAEPMRYGKK